MLGFLYADKSVYALVSCGAAFSGDLPLTLEPKIEKSVQAQCALDVYRFASYAAITQNKITCDISKQYHSHVAIKSTLHR